MTSLCPAIISFSKLLNILLLSKGLLVYLSLFTGKPNIKLFYLKIGNIDLYLSSFLKLSPLIIRRE